MNINQYCCYRTISSALQQFSQFYCIISSDSHLCLLLLMKAAIDWWWSKLRLSAWQRGGEYAAVTYLHTGSRAWQLCILPQPPKGHLRGDVLSSPASQLRLEKDAVLCLVAPLSQHTPAFHVFYCLTGAKLASETKGVLWSHEYTKTNNDLAHACVHVLGDKLHCIQVYSQTGQSNPMELAAKTR